MSCRRPTPRQVFDYKCHATDQFPYVTLQYNALIEEGRNMFEKANSNIYNVVKGVSILCREGQNCIFRKARCNCAKQLSIHFSIN